MNRQVVVSIYLLLFILFPAKAQNREIACNADSVQVLHRYKIAVCDWMILKRQKIGSFMLVPELNGDGVELAMGSLGKRETFDHKLRDHHFQHLFRDTAREFTLAAPSIAMYGLHGQSLL